MFAADSSGLLIGMIITFMVLEASFRALFRSWIIWAQLAVLMGAGITLGGLFLALPKVGTFVVGAFPPMLLVNILYQFISALANYSSDLVHLCVVVGVGVIGGALAVWKSPNPFMYLTAFMGGYMLCGGVQHFLFVFGATRSFPALDPAYFFLAYSAESPLLKSATYSDWVFGVLMGVWLLMFTWGTVWWRLVSSVSLASIAHIEPCDLMWFVF